MQQDRTERNAPPFQRTARVTLPADPASVAAARRWTADVLRDRPTATVEIAELLVSEVATNVVLHARTDFDLAVDCAGDRTHFEITDRCPALPTKDRYPPEQTIGRGLTLLDQLAAAWGVVPERASKMVWFDLDDS